MRLAFHSEFGAGLRICSNIGGNCGVEPGVCHAAPSCGLAIMLTLAYSLFNGVVASWYSVMNITFEPLPLGPKEQTDQIIGYIGILSIVGNCVTSILVSRIVDSLRGKMKATLCIIMFAGCGCWI